jgi:hypothetical protein
MMSSFSYKKSSTESTSDTCFARIGKIAFCSTQNSDEYTLGNLHVHSSVTIPAFKYVSYHADVYDNITGTIVS